MTELSQADSKFIQQARVCRLERDTRHKQDGRVRHRHEKGKGRALTEPEHSADDGSDSDGSSSDGDDGTDGGDGGADDEAGEDADVPPLALKVACAGEVSYNPTLDHSPNGPLHVEGGVKILWGAFGDQGMGEKFCDGHSGGKADDDAEPPMRAIRASCHDFDDQVWDIYDFIRHAGMPC
mgnify:CR=1 FL=1